MTTSLPRPALRPEALRHPALDSWGDFDRDDPFPLFAAVRSAAPVHEVTLADGHPAWLVVGHEEARAALNDPRLSKDMHAALAHSGEVVAEGLPGPEPPAGTVAASDALVAYLHALLDLKRRTPGEDLVTDLVAAADRDGALTEQEMASTIFQLVVAGHDTTTSLIGNGTVALLKHPAQRDALAADPGLAAQVVEECLRWDAPVPHSTFRYTTGEVRLGGAVIPAYAQVIVSLAAANWDPARYRDPETFDVRRSDGGHLAFGHGIHHCLGAPLARLEGRIALAELHTRFPTMRLALGTSELRWGHGDGLVLRGLTELPVLLGPPAV